MRESTRSVPGARRDKDAAAPEGLPTPEGLVATPEALATDGGLAAPEALSDNGHVPAEPPEALHRTLVRQMRRLGVSPLDLPTDVAEWNALLDDVSRTYARAESTASVQARKDALTGLPNRVAVLDMLRTALGVAGTGSESVAVLFVDLDGFKLVNDTLGHSIGDVLLVRVARLLEQSVRDGDIVARMGGDEFVVLSPACDEDTADAVAGRIGAVLDTPITIGEHELFVTVSIGVAVGGPDSGSADLLRDADMAMYEAKARGRAQFVRFDDRMRQNLQHRVEIESALHRAASNDELRLYYQPIIRLSDGRLTGMEALIRWQRPGHGMVDPADFVEVAEHTRLIRMLDSWVLRNACLHAVSWGDPSIKVAVNLSARDLEHEDVVRTLGATLHRTGLASGRLIIELTERTLMSDSPAIATNLQRLRALGVAIAIDDFGTGYSSLSYLGRLPASIVKIDRSFIEAIDTDESAATVVGAIVTMAHALGLTVVAEGVERVAQADRLSELGCDSAQGYLFSIPVPDADAAELVARRRFRTPSVTAGTG